MRVAKGCLWIVLAILLLRVQSAEAASVNYSLVSGQITAVTVDDGDPNTPGDTDNRLEGAPLSLDSAQVMVDFEALTLDILSVGRAAPGVVTLGGINGWDSVTFSNASFTSTLGGPLNAPPPASPSDYAFGVTVRVLASLLLDPAFPGDPIPASFDDTSNAGGTITAIAGNETLRITVGGVVLGYLQDPTDELAPLVLVKADFDFIAAAPAPEPGAAPLALLGALLALARRRTC